MASCTAPRRHPTTCSRSRGTSRPRAGPCDRRPPNRDGVRPRRPSSIEQSPRTGPRDGGRQSAGRGSPPAGRRTSPRPAGAGESKQAASARGCRLYADSRARLASTTSTNTCRARVEIVAGVMAPPIIPASAIVRRTLSKTRVHELDPACAGSRVSSSSGSSRSLRTCCAKNRNGQPEVGFERAHAVDRWAMRQRRAVECRQRLRRSSQSQAQPLPGVQSCARTSMPASTASSAKIAVASCSTGCAVN